MAGERVVPVNGAPRELSVLVLLICACAPKK
jgi:hypothetical protein